MSFNALSRSCLRPAPISSIPRGPESIAGRLFVPDLPRVMSQCSLTIPSAPDMRVVEPLPAC